MYELDCQATCAFRYPMRTAWRSARERTRDRIWRTCALFRYNANEGPRV